ncbi:MAG: hypothetical protein QNJ40_19565 [Xanthomonadales bacterium]|nr:hypothetical protein [Xanthomonadales bacterium]
MKTMLTGLTLGLSAVGCAADQSAFVVNDHQLKLTGHSTSCQLLDPKTHAVMDLLIPAPCQVHRTTQGTVRVHQESGRHYFLVESSRPHPELPDDCETHLQSVMVYQGTVTPSSLSDRVAACPPFQWDTKVFTGLFD